MDDGKGETETPGGGKVSYRALEADGPGFYYDLAGCADGRNWGPFPTRDIAERWHETPDSINDDDIAAIRKTQGYT
jgi:hypothetical protein